MKLQPIEKQKEVMQQYRNQIYKIKEDTGLTEEGKQEKLEKMQLAISNQFESWKEEVAKAQEQVETELAAKKPTTVNTVYRSLDKTSIENLSYHVKIIKSRIAAEGRTKEGLRSILKEVVDEGNAITQQAFMDGYADLLSLVESIESLRVSGKSYLEEFYKNAKDLNKTQEQVAYEEAESEAFSRVNSLNMSIIVAERNIFDFQAALAIEINKDIPLGDDEEDDEDQGEKTIWD